MIVALWDRARLAEDSARRRRRRLGRRHARLQHPLAGRGRRGDRGGARGRRRGSAASPAETFWGGYSGAFIDPDGHPWEIAHNPRWTVHEDGSVSLTSPSVNETRSSAADFPASRKGYDRAAVDAHLRRLADEIARLQRGAGAGVSSVADGAGEKVGRDHRLGRGKGCRARAGGAGQRADEIVADGSPGGRRPGRARPGRGRRAGAARPMSCASGSASWAAAIGGRPTGPRVRDQPRARGRARADDPPARGRPDADIVPEPSPEPPRSPSPSRFPSRHPIRSPSRHRCRPSPTSPRRPTATRPAAKLVAMKMALEGSSREEIEAALVGELRAGRRGDPARRRARPRRALTLAV